MGWEYVAILIVGLLVATSMRRAPPAVKPASLEDFEFPQSTEGTPQCVIFGDCWVDDWMVLGVGNFRSKPIRK